MRVRLGLLLGAVLATLLSPLSSPAFAVSTLPSAPTSVTSTAIAGGLRADWSAPTDLSSGITGYKIEWSSNGISGSWTQAGTVGGSTYTFNILGLSQVETYIRVSATSSGGYGPAGYPWTKIYGTTSSKNNSGDGSINYESTFGIGAGNASNTYAASNFTRVKYRLDTTINGTADYAETDFYTWVTTPTTSATTRTVAPSIANLQIPVPINTSQGFVIQANVTDLNVYSSNSRVTNAGGLSGRLEIWPWNYDKPTVGLSPSGNGSNYDFEDTPATGNTSATAGAYGSFQVHDLTNSKTVFAWNFHQYSGVTDPDLGYGNNPNTNGQPDWTFCHDNTATNGYCQSITNFRLQIYVNIPVTPLADATPPTVTRIDSRFYVKNADTITVRSSEVGTVYLVSQAVTVTNLASITAASTNTKNSATVSSANTDTTMTIGYQSDGLYNLYAADSAGNLSTAILATIRIDNTAPTASSIVVNSSGTAILLTANETITNSAQIFTYYTISDSGSAITVTATSFAGSVATLTLSRAIPAGATVYFQYNMGAGLPAGKWIDQAGNEMASIWNRTITNNSAIPISVSLLLPDPIAKGISITATAVVNVAGKVTFTLAGKRVPGCINKVASGTTPISVTCSFKPALSAQQTIAATLVPTLSAYPNTTGRVDRYILKRSTTR